MIAPTNKGCTAYTASLPLKKNTPIAVNIKNPKLMTHRPLTFFFEGLLSISKKNRRIFCSDFLKTKWSNSKMKRLLTLALVVLSQCVEILCTEEDTNNWAVLVSTSKFWFNYRHAANTLSFYHAVKEFGVPDANILLMLADDVACNPRNQFPARVYNSGKKNLNLYDTEIEVDYRGLEVTANTFVRLLTDRLDADTPSSKRLHTNEKSNILIYVSGHGGEGFLKFQDTEELSDQDIADAIHEMKEKKRFNEMLFIADTCHAESLLLKVNTPGVLGISSARIDQDSYSFPAQKNIGVSVIDRFTYASLEFLRRNPFSKRPTIYQWFAHLRQSNLISTPVMNTKNYHRDVRNVLMSDFFGALVHVKPTNRVVSLSRHVASHDENNEQVFTLTPEIDGSSIVVLPMDTMMSFVEKVDRRVAILCCVVIALFSNYYLSSSFQSI